MHGMQPVFATPHVRACCVTADAAALAHLLASAHAFGVEDCVAAAATSLATKVRSTLWQVGKDWWAALIAGMALLPSQVPSLPSL